MSVLKSIYLKILKYVNLKNNAILKILALFSALFLWIYVVLRSPEKKSIYIPIQIIKPDSLIFDGDPPDSVRFDFSGSMRNFFLFEKFGNPSVSLDLNNLVVGENTIEIIPDNIIYSDWIGVKPEGKSYINLSVQKLDSIIIPVNVDDSVLTPSNWIIRSLSINPDIIWIVGGQSDLEKISDEGVFIKTCTVEEFAYEKICTTFIYLPELATHPYSKDSTVEIHLLMDSLINYEVKLGVEVIGNDNFQVMPDSVRFFAAIPSKDYDSFQTTEILLTVEGRRSGIHSSPLHLKCDYIELAETSWLEISKVKLIPKNQ